MSSPSERPTGADSPSILERLRTSLAGRYFVETELQQGGMSRVFLARDLRLRRRVVIKVLAPELADSLGAERFLREIRVTAQLSHPHILTLFDSGEIEGLLYYVMPYVVGESLADRLRREGPLPLEEAVRIAAQVADALSFAHAQGVVHRDVKPANILLEGEGHVTVADFGLARAFYATQGEQLTAAGLVVGTPAYISPEQIQNAGAADARSDVYGLGCVVYEMLSGRTPFTGDTLQDVLMQHLLEPPPALRAHRADLPPALERAVMRALAKAPAERYATPAHLARALEDAARPRHASEQRRPAIRRFPGARSGIGRRLYVGVAAALAAVLLIGAGVAWWGRRPGPPLPSTTAVVILPLRAGGTTPAARDTAGLQQLLSTSLESVPGLRALDGSALLAPGTDWRSARQSSVLAGAARLNGGYLAVTEAVGVAPTLIAIELYDVRGVRLGRWTSAPGEPPDAAVERISLEIATAIAGQHEGEFRSIQRLLTTTHSAAALSDLLQARELLWAGQAEAAIEGFQRALERDPNFAPAYFYLSLAESWPPRWGYGAALQILDVGIARRDSMSVRWAGLLDAQRRYLLREGREAISSFYHLAAEDPEFAEAYFGLGESHFHLGGLAGSPPSNSAPAFERLIAIDPDFAPDYTYGHLVDAALWRGDTAVARRHVQRIPDRAKRSARETNMALRFGSADARREAALSLSTLPSSVLPHLIEVTADRPTLMDSVAQAYLAPDRSASEHQVGARFRMAALAAQGRWEEAEAIWRASPAKGAFDPWVMHAYLAGFPADAVAVPMIEVARRVVAEPGPIDFRDLDSFRPHAVRALVQLNLTEGDSVESQELLDRLRDARADRTDPEPDGLRLSLQARLKLLEADTGGAIAALEAALTRGPWVVDSYFVPLADGAPQRLLLARLYAARGDSDRATRWAETFGHVPAVGDVLFQQRAEEVLESLRAVPEQAQLP